jgi:hypothetical protein
LMSSSYLKNSTYIRLAGMYGGWPAETASDARRHNPQRITLSFRAPTIRQTVPSGHPRPAGESQGASPLHRSSSGGHSCSAGAHYQASQPSRSITSRHLLPAGANFPRVET